MDTAKRTFGIIIDRIKCLRFSSHEYRAVTNSLKWKQIYQYTGKRTGTALTYLKALL